MGQATLEGLLEATFAGPVFGPGVAFGADETRLTTVQRQIAVIDPLLRAELGACLQQALPDNLAVAQSTVAQVVTKTEAFVPALTAGDITPEFTPTLGLAALAVTCMYTADQLMDRGDEKMLAATEDYSSSESTHSLSTEDNPRIAVLERMTSAIRSLALEEDTPAVLECFVDQVLRHEAELQRLSAAYNMPQTDRRAFLATHGEGLARHMVVDAGVPSVTGSLYAIYRRQNPTLPTLATIHGDPKIQNLLQVFNTTARIADELGDWPMDAGHDPRYGIFSINPFNQYEPTMIETFCETAGISNQSTVAELQDHFKHFHEGETSRAESGKFITSIFFDQVRRVDAACREEYSTTPGFTVYLSLCERVAEISFINMIGDIQLAGE